MKHELLTVSDAGSLATRAAALVVVQARTAVADHGRFSFAVSGGGPRGFCSLSSPSSACHGEASTSFQVDERVVPENDPDRNLAHLRHQVASS